MDINYSIIIPHYNIPDLLMRCLRSIPVREDVQVIVVDDCSPDADTYLERYPELSSPYLEFYSTEKGGSAGRARNVGLEHAKGKWLIFADADDLFSEHFSHILDKYKDNHNDILFFNCRFVKSDDIYSEIHRGDDYFIKRLFSCDNPEAYARCDCPMPWGKLIKRSLVESSGAKYSTTRWSNDIYFSTVIGCSADTISLIDEEMYVATVREESLTSDFCESNAELIQRTFESIKAQSVISQHDFKMDEFVCSPYIAKCYFRSIDLFWAMINLCGRYNIATISVLWQLSRRVGVTSLLKTLLKYPFGQIKELDVVNVNNQDTLK